jgi:hypothetical protein
MGSDPQNLDNADYEQKTVEMVARSKSRNFWGCVSRKLPLLRALTAS